MYFSVTRARFERERERLSVVALNRVSLLFPSPPHRRMHATSADGGIYIMRARKTAIRPTELRLYRGRVCACLSRDQLPPRNIRWDPRPTCELELLKFGLDGKK